MDETATAQPVGEREERSLVGHREDDGVGVLGEGSTIEEIRALTRRVGDVGSEETSWEVVANDDVVIGGRGRAVGRGGCGGFSELAGCS